MDFFKKGLSKVKETMSQVDLLAKLAEATTNDSSFANISLLNEISSRSDNREDCDLIVFNRAPLCQDFNIKTKNVEKNSKGIGPNRTCNENRKPRFYR